VIRVLIADDQALVRASFRLLVDTAPGLEAVGEAADGRAAVAMTRSLLPDVVLMDVRMPVVDGIEATRTICHDEATAGVRVLILTTFDLDEYVFAALRAGASGFLVKDTPPSELLSGIAVVASGEGLLAPSVTARLITEFARLPVRTASGTIEALTEREREVLVLIARGLSNLELAAHLHLSLATVKTHIGRLLAKLAARDRAQLVIAAYESGLIAPGDLSAGPG